jgi:hypothetical protein
MISNGEILFYTFAYYSVLPYIFVYLQKFDKNNRFKGKAPNLNQATTLFKQSRASIREIQVLYKWSITVYHKKLF